MSTSVLIFFIFAHRLVSGDDTLIHIRKWMLILMAAAILVLGIVLSVQRKNEIPASSTAERMAYAKRLGYSVNEYTETAKSVVIPQEFGSVYTQYNKLQLAAGFDLQKYKGREAVIYEYELYEYAECEDTVYIHFIVIDGVLVGGDICSARLNGFMHGLTKSSQIE